MQGEDWEDGFADGLMHSLCFFPLLSYGATAPLAPFPEDTEKEAIASGWEERPVGRMRLRGEESDAEDNMLKELLIAVTLLNYRSAATASLLESNGADVNEERADSESAGQLQVKFCVHAYVFCMSWSCGGGSVLTTAALNLQLTRSLPLATSEPLEFRWHTPSWLADSTQKDILNIHAWAASSFCRVVADTTLTILRLHPTGLLLSSLTIIRDCQLLN